MATQKLDVGFVPTAPEFKVTDAQGHVVGALRVSVGGLYW
jgi:hypothetical protein